jgi:hypothetical protein
MVKLAGSMGLNRVMPEATVCKRRLYTRITGTVGTQRLSTDYDVPYCRNQDHSRGTNSRLSHRSKSSPSYSTCCLCYPGVGNQ